MSTPTTTRPGWLAFLPVVADGTAALALILLLPTLVAPLSAPAGWNALLLAIFYLLFCIGVYLVRKLIPGPQVGRWQPPGWLMRPKVLGLLGVIFGLFMVTALAYQLGYFASMFAVGPGFLEEGSTAAFFVFAPGAWLGFSMLVILVLAFPVNATIAPASSAYAVMAFLGLLAMDSMIFFATAQASALSHFRPFAAPLFEFFVWLLVFALAFIPARMYYQSRQPALPGLLSFGALLLMAVILIIVG